MKKLNKTFKKLELEIYCEDPEKADFIKYLRFNGFEKVAEGFLNKDFAIIGEALSENDMLTYNDIIEIIATVAFYSK